MITQARLKECLRYIPSIGVFEWRRPGRGVRVGSIAGVVNKSTGYVVITLDGRQYRAHHLAWLYVTGELPADDLDHKDGDTTNNLFSNLRLADGKNQWNKRRSVANKSGVKGVSFRSDVGKWEARLEARGVKHWLGYFDSLDAAEEAVRSHREETHGEFANHGEHLYQIEEKGSA